MKSYTDLEQSKKLTEILPIESADNYYSHEFVNSAGDYYKLNIASEGYFDNEELLGSDIPCWSLAALLDLCPTINGKQPILTRGKLTSLWYCYYEDEIDTQTYDNPIDVCYEMITRLNELNLL